MADEAVDSEALRLVGVLLTAEIFNQHEELDANDLTPADRELFGAGIGSSEVRRPLTVSEGALKKTHGIDNARKKVRQNPFVAYEEFGQRLRVTSLEPAARWFIRKGGEALVSQNPTLAFYFEKFDSVKVSYAEARAHNPLVEDTKAHLDAKVAKVLADSEPLRSAVDLLIISAPDEIEQQLEELVCTNRQANIIDRVQTAIQHRAFLREHRIYEIGKILFVGPPGTGKTSLALAISHRLHLPVLEVRLSMITSQYLGETSKNVDRVFEFAKKLAPCILFIDEFDYVAKSRVTDDHGAMKRAVNMLLKNIDRISLVRDGVLLIGATNHPQLLDEAAWRRFDEVIEFSLPDERMREAIIRKITASLSCHCDPKALAARTEGFSGADLRIMLKEAVISSLIRHSREICMDDIETGIALVENRNALKCCRWV